ncbi:putative RNA methyltransferase [Ananas comosus]|uniref:Putative RNA methyltransferase n=1 Tax=Ananas comosus TaxID=4615 RepID=A0A199W4I8_ANACO|nr:putative RNA methyltransferase [Ananas comosus]
MAAAAAAAAAAPGFGARSLNARSPFLLALRCSASSACPSPSPSRDSDPFETPPPPNSSSSSTAAATTMATSPPRPFFPKRGQTLELVCESLAFKGKGVCRAADTGFVLMCDRALPGERFLGRVSRKKPTYAEVTKLKTLTPHRDFVEAPCEYASHCGGCKTQNLLYEAQIRAKEQQVRDLIVHVGRFDDRDPDFAGVLKPIVPCDVQFHYRNKMEFSFGAQRWVPRDESMVGKDKTDSGFALGLHAPGFFDKVLHVEKCLLQSEAANKVLAVIQDSWMDPSLGFSPYNVHTHRGFLKHLMLRTGRHLNTGLPELMVNFVTASYKPELLEPLVSKISAIPEVVSIVNNVNTSMGNTSVGEEEYTLYGKSTITEMLRGLTFQISANSFFQTNSKQAEVLYKLIEDCAGLKGDGSEIVLDLFCGTGTIGLTLARKVRHVYGYEVVAEAISDAQRNAELNGIHNATFVQGDLNKINDTFGNDFPKPDIVISDPNRPGMHMKLIKYLLKIQAPRIVYVSCNPATCARDIDYLCHGVDERGIKGRYLLKRVIPVDMFPHTPHIECVCLLELC